jgi:hypothetical protein
LAFLRPRATTGLWRERSRMQVSFRAGEPLRSRWPGISALLRTAAWIGRGRDGGLERAGDRLADVTSQAPPAADSRFARRRNPR